MNTKIKVIFLDVDGVLNSSQDHFSIGLKTDIHLERLKRIIDATGAKIVLSSSWRICFDPKKDQMSRILNNKLNSIGAPIMDMTPIIREPNKVRGDEIRMWLQDHPDVDAFIILDDDSDMAEYTSTHLIKTDVNIGLQDSDVEKAINMLGRVSNE